MAKTSDFLAAWAGLMGACGVAAAAASAHLPDAGRMSSVGLILLVHAAAIVALTARVQNAIHPKLWLASALVLAVGASLFSADVTLLTLRGARLFPMAAPSGGTAMIFGWLIVCAAGLTGLIRR